MSNTLIENKVYLLVNKVFLKSDNLFFYLQVNVKPTKKTSVTKGLESNLVSRIY